MRAVCWMLVWFGCESRSPTPPVGEPPPAAAGSAGVASVLLDASLESLALDVIPPIGGPVTTVEERETVTVGGVAITFEYSTHKHRKKGPAVGEWRFTLAKDGATETIELDSDGNTFEAEVAAHGVFLVFRKVGYTRFEIVLAAERAPAPLDEEACKQRIVAAAARTGWPRSDRSSGMWQDLGVIAYSEHTTWNGHCGPYSQRIWFTTRRPRDF